MSRFMLAHLNNGRFDHAQILAPETTQLMHATAFVPVAGAQGIALGFFRNDTNGHRIISHDGDLSGFHSDLQLLLDDGVGFFTSVNSDGTCRLLAPHTPCARRCFRSSCIAISRCRLLRQSQLCPVQRSTPSS